MWYLILTSETHCNIVESQETKQHCNDNQSEISILVFQPIRSEYLPVQNLSPPTTVMCRMNPGCLTIPTFFPSHLTLRWPIRDQYWTINQSEESILPEVATDQRGQHLHESKYRGVTINVGQYILVKKQCEPLNILIQLLTLHSLTMKTWFFIHWLPENMYQAANQVSAQKFMRPASVEDCFLFGEDMSGPMRRQYYLCWPIRSKYSHLEVGWCLVDLSLVLLHWSSAASGSQWQLS